MKMLKRIFGTVVFWGIGILLFFAVSYTLRPADNKFYRKDFTGFYGEEENSLDIVGLGGSALNRYFNNPVLWEEQQLTSYNLTTADQSCFMIEHLIDEVEKTQSPQLYIVEIRKFLNAKDKSSYNDRFSMVIDNMKYSRNRIKLINHMIEDKQERFEYYFDIVKYHENWESFQYPHLSYADNRVKDSEKGWQNIALQKEVKKPKMIPLDKIEPMPIAEECEEALRSLLKKCQTENIPVLFVSTPFGINKKSQRKNAYIAQIIEEAGFKFLDCNQYIEEIGLDFSKDFFDARHANVIGTEKITKFIGAYIQENYKLDTEHNETVTADWNTYVERNRIDAEVKKEKLKNK